MQESDNREEQTANLHVEQARGENPQVVDRVGAHVVGGFLQKIGKHDHPKEKHDPRHYTAYESAAKIQNSLCMKLNERKLRKFFASAN